MPGHDDAIVELEDVVARWSEESLFDDEQTLALLLDDTAEWISLAAAEEEAKVSRSTLRAWYRSGRIPSRLMPGPHGLQRLVPREAVLTQAARSPRSGRAADAQEKEDPQVPSDAVRLAELAIAEARDRTAAAEARAEAAEAALREALERAAAAETELRLLRHSNGG